MSDHLLYWHENANVFAEDVLMELGLWVTSKRDVYCRRVLSWMRRRSIEPGQRSVTQVADDIRETNLATRWEEEQRQATLGQDG